MLKLTQLLEFHRIDPTIVHDTWWDRLPHADMLHRLLNEPAGRFTLSEYLQELYPHLGQWQDVTTPEIEPILLMPKEVVQQLLQYAAATVFHETLRQTIDREKLNQALELLGQDAYQFAMHRAAFSPMGIEPAFELAGDSPDDAECMIAVIYAAIIKSLTHLPDSIVSRFILKLPATWYEKAVVYTGKIQVNGPALLQQLQRLTKGSLGQWYALYN